MAGDKKRAKPVKTAPPPDPPKERARPDAAVASAIRPGTDAGTKLGSSLGIIAAMIAAVLLNVYVARHYKRWDWTRGGLYTLSDATLKTLHDLEEPLTVYVLLSSGDPLALSAQHLLDQYAAETSRISVKFTDPDRHPAEFLAIQQRYEIVAGKTEDGRIVTDAAIIVVRGDKPFFLTSHDLVEVDDEDDLRARPRLEQAITGAIRSLLSGDRPKICFTSGHGERSIEVGGGQGLAALRERLTKNNYEAIELEPTHPRGAASAPTPTSENKTPIAECRVVVVAGPTEAFSPEDAAELRGFIAGGGNAFLAVGPQPDAADQHILNLGLGDVVGLAGVRLGNDFVFERDPKDRSTQGFGETFLPIAKPHAITDGLLKEAARGVSVVMTIGSSLEPTNAGAAAAVPLLVTSDQAFGMTDFFTWAKNPSVPSPTAADKKGPLTVAFATELPKKHSDDPHGPRIVVVGSSSVLLGANWQAEELRGTALFVESALSWLSAKPVFLDIPNKPAFTAGLHVSDESLAAIFRYVVFFVPLSPVLFGIAIHLRRRGTERRGHPRAKKRRKGEGPSEPDHDEKDERGDAS